MDKIDFTNYFEKRDKIPFRAILFYWYLKTVDKDYAYKTIEKNKYLEEEKQRLIREIEELFGDSEVVLYDPALWDCEDFIERLKNKLDTRSLMMLNEVETKLDEFISSSNSGNKSSVLYILSDLIDKYQNKIIYKVEKPIHIFPNYDIELRDFNNFPLSLPDLTKAIYILFVKHPKGINIKELHKYQDELLEIYIKVSPRADLEQLKKSVADVVNIDNKLIQSHFSRIKSTLTKIMGKHIAKYYIITSKKHGSSFKFIPVMGVSDVPDVYIVDDPLPF